MDTLTRCPNGHEVGDGEVVCTICWSKVDTPVAETSNGPLSWPPSPMAAAVVGSVLLVVGAGASIVSVNTSMSAIVAEPLADTTVTLPVAAAPAAAAEQPAAAGPTAVSVVAPQAATIAVPVTLVSCVPAGSADINVSARNTSSEAWGAVPAKVTFGEGVGCATDETRAEIYVETPPVSGPDAEWRLVAVDADGTRVWKSTTVQPSE